MSEACIAVERIQEYSDEDIIENSNQKLNN